MFFLPPRFHVLLRLEIRPEMTLARIATDCWATLAYVDALLDRLAAPGV